MAETSFSVIIPTYRSRDKLALTLTSVLSQDYPGLECLVLDGGSDDGTKEDLESLAWDHRLRWWSEADGGIYNAMNKGVHAATNEFLYFLGAGDVLRPGVLTQVAAIARRFRRPHFLYGDVFWVDRNVRYAGPFNLYRLLRLNICHQAIFHHRSLFPRLGYFNERYPVCADYDFNLRCFGRRSVRKHYMDLTVADFEGGGVSAHPYGDPRFLAEFSHLVREALGPIGYQLHLHYDKVERLKSRWEVLRRKFGRG